MMARMCDRRTVLLRHETDAGWHYDWMLEPPAGAGEPEARVVITFRVAHDPAEVRRCSAERLPDHRAAYLQTEERVLSDGRGRVARVWAGTIRWAQFQEGVCRGVLIGASRSGEPIGFEVVRRESGVWSAVFEVLGPLP